MFNYENLFSKPFIYLLLEMVDPTHDENFYMPHRLYSFTLNAEDQYQYFGSPTRLEKVKAYYYSKLLESLDKYTQYIAYLEFSEPHGNVASLGPRAHIHGTFYFKSKKLLRAFLINGMYQLRKSCHLDIDTVSHASTWARYITKQQDIIHTAPFTNDIRMIVDQTSSDEEEGNDFRQDAIEKKKTLNPPRIYSHAPTARGLKLSPKARRSATKLRDTQSPELFILE